jgi:hypothetical protein
MFGQERQPRFLVLANSALLGWADVGCTTDGAPSDETVAQLWAALRDASGPLYMPCLFVHDEPATARYGRPRVEQARFVRSVLSAWLCDLNGGSAYGVARMLYGGDPEAPRKKAQRDVRAGRKALRGAGVLPWAAWRNGTLPKAWWQTIPFRDAVDQWVRETDKISTIVTTPIDLGRVVRLPRSIRSPYSQQRPLR